MKLGSAKVNEMISFKKNVTLSALLSLEDLYLLSDATGSMASAIATIKARIKELIASRKAAGSNVAFGVGFYRDEGSKPLAGESLKDGFSNLQSITTNEKAVLDAANSITASKGGDVPEAGLVALYRIATDPSIKWRPGSRRIVVIFGDAPQHEPVCINGLRITRQSVIAALKAKGITVVAINLGTPGLNLLTLPYGCKNETGLQPGNQMNEITKATGGSIASATNPADIVSAIVQAVNNLPLKLTVDSSSCSPDYTIGYNVTFPLTVTRKSTFCIQQKITVNPAACLTDPPKKCTVKYLVGASTLAEQMVSAGKIAGCQR